MSIWNDIHVMYSHIQRIYKINTIVFFIFKFLVLSHLQFLVLHTGTNVSQFSEMVFNPEIDYILLKYSSKV